MTALSGAGLLSKLGSRRAFTFGFLLQSFLISTQLPVAFKTEWVKNGGGATGADTPFYYKQGFLEAFLYIGSILSGVGSATSWIAQGEYTAQCASEETKGKIFGIFWCMYMAAQISGNFIASLLIDQTSLSQFFVTFTVMMVVFSMGYMFLPKPQSLDPE